MNKNGSQSAFKHIYINTKTFFIISLIVIFLTITSIWLFGLEHQRKIYDNSILFTSLLSIAFFLFITIGLYKGVKLKDNIGKITDKIKFKSYQNLHSFDTLPSTNVEGFGEGVIGILIAFLFWLLVSMLFIILIIFFSTIIWAMMLVFIAMLYWIFFRALRLVFKNSIKCKGNLGLSFIYGISYTVLYNFWIYGIIWISHYLI